MKKPETVLLDLNLFGFHIKAAWNQDKVAIQINESCSDSQKKLKP